jgi:hypothetical protein
MFQVDDEDNIYLGGQTANNFNMTTVASLKVQIHFHYGFFCKIK